MPFITVHMYPGRTHEQKAQLAKAITDAVVNIAKTTPDATEIVFIEVPREHWARAGVLASDRK